MEAVANVANRFDDEGFLVMGNSIDRISSSLFCYTLVHTSDEPALIFLTCETYTFPAA
jgi:hypothetical protein